MLYGQSLIRLIELLPTVFGPSSSGELTGCRPWKSGVKEERRQV
jgi:hypothetical protein